MPDDVIGNTEHGPGKFRALFDRGLDFAVDRLLRRARAQGGTLSEADLLDEIQRFRAFPEAAAVDYFRDAWEECSLAVEHLRWDQERRYPFERLMVNTFVHLLPSGQQVPVAGEHLPRRVIPGFVTALEQMLGEELGEKYQEFCRALVARLKATHGARFAWEMVHNDPEAAETVTEVLVTVCHHFVDMKKRRRWLTDVINGHMGAPTATQDVPFEDMECHRLIAALYQPLRDAMNTPAGEQRIAERFGRDRSRLLRAVFAEITRDHRELALGLVGQR